MNQLFRPSDYLRPTNLNEALSALEKNPGAGVVAGGTDLLIDKKPSLRCLVDISRIGLDKISENQPNINIGSCTTLRSIERSPFLQAPSLNCIVEAASSIGGVAVRNVATVGGNLCNAVPSADMPPPLIALDSHVRIAGPAGPRDMLLERFFVDVRKTVLARTEILVEIEVPTPSEESGSSFLKLGRAAHDIAIVNVAAKISLDRGICRSARIVLGAVAPAPMRVPKAESRLEGRHLDSNILEEAAEVAALEARPISDLRASAEYRREMVRVLTRRALCQALLRVRSGS